MPDWITSRRCLLILVCAGALIIGPTAATTAAGATKAVDLRVTSPEPSVQRDEATSAGLGGSADLADHTQYTARVSVTAAPGATCFGPGAGGSGEKVKISGATALGAVRDALRAKRALRPLLITDAFSFGLGVCGIGGFQAPVTGFWYLKHNHVGAAVGGDQLSVKKGDEVLWHLVSDFTQPLPSELEINAASLTAPGSSIEVTVYEYADDGTRSPAAGVSVSAGGAAAAQAAGLAPGLTDANGKTTVTVADAGELVLGASRGEDIPAAQVRVCVADSGGDCSGIFEKRIFGTDRRDRVRGSGKNELIKPAGDRDIVKAGAGDDLVKARGGGVDEIDCGPGEDIAKVSKNDKPKRNCEVVKVA